MTGMLTLLFRLALSMGVVMAVMYLAARLARRRQGMSGRLRPARKQRSTLGWGSTTHAATTRSLALSRPRPKGVFGTARRDEAPAQVTCRLPLGKGAWAVLIDASGRRLLLGVTEQRVELLADLGKEGPLDLDAGISEGTTPSSLEGLLQDEQPAAAWKLALDSLRERTVRR